MGDGQVTARQEYIDGLRKLANLLVQHPDLLDAEQPQLTPTPADQVKVGDLIRPGVESWLKVESIDVARRAEDPPVTRHAMLKFKGPMKSPHGENFQCSHTAYTDEWVVVERPRTSEGLAVQVADAFNRHGKFTARLIPDTFDAEAVEVRYVDTGDIAATVWPAVDGRPEWRWLGGQPGMGVRRLPEATTVPELVRAVATHVLDEVKR